MKSRQNKYFSHLSEAMVALLNRILKEDSLNPFRRAPQVKLGLPPSLSGDDFYLVLVGKKQTDNDKGSFTCPMNDDKFLVFRLPVRICVSFLLCGYNVSSHHKVSAYDKLNTYFFDRRSLEPFLPDGYREFPALHKQLQSRKAEIRINDSASYRSLMAQEGDGKKLDAFHFAFDYTALYHSGNPLREDHKIRQRVIDLNNEGKERSVL